MEKIEAHNKQLNCRLNTSTGDMDFAVLIKAFQFQKQLMHQHFNDDYLESKIYPKATFQGQIMNINKFDLSKDGNYPVTVSGTLNLHGVSKRIMEKGTLRVIGGNIAASSKFPISLSDYDVKIPIILKDKIAKTVLVEINVELKPE